MSGFGGFGGFGQNNNQQQSTPFGGFGSTTNTNTGRSISYSSPLPPSHLVSRTAPASSGPEDYGTQHESIAYEYLLRSVQDLALQAILASEAQTLPVVGSLAVVLPASAALEVCRPRFVVVMDPSVYHVPWFCPI
jgi:hypothetical protein